MSHEYIHVLYVKLLTYIPPHLQNISGMMLSWEPSCTKAASSYLHTVIV